MTKTKKKEVLKTIRQKIESIKMADSDKKRFLFDVSVRVEKYPDESADEAIASTMENYSDDEKGVFLSTSLLAIAKSQRSETKKIEEHLNEVFSEPPVKGGYAYVDGCNQAERDRIKKEAMQIVKDDDLTDDDFAHGMNSFDAKVLDELLERNSFIHNGTRWEKRA